MIKFDILLANPESPKGPSFWSYGRAAYEYVPTFGCYQLATRSQSPSMKDDDDTLDSPFKNDEVCYVYFCKTCLL